MHRISQKLELIYNNYKLLPLCLCAAVIIDYSLTFYFAGSAETVLRYEYSPALLYALRHGIVLPYIASMVLFYYAAGYVVLKFLADSEIYFVGAAVVLLISLTHVLGGMSWYIRNSWYSNSVISLSMISVLITLTIFAYEIFNEAHKNA